MILLQTFVSVTVALLGFLLFALYLVCVDKFLNNRQQLDPSPVFYVAVAAGAAGGVMVPILYSVLIAQLVSWAGGMSA